MKKLLLSLFICISSFSFSQVGIDTDSPTKTLDVNGEVRIRTANPSTSTKDINLVIDSDGIVKRDSKESDGLFRGYLSKDFDTGNVTGQIYKITNFYVLQNPGKNFDTNSNEFTVKTTSLYKVTFSATIKSTNTSMMNVVVGLANASTKKWLSRFNIMQSNLTTDDLANMYTFIGLVKLNKGDKCYFGISAYSKLLYLPTGGTGSGLGTFFEIQLVSTEE